MIEDVELNPEHAVLDVDLLYRVGTVRKDRSRLRRDAGLKKTDFHYPLAGLVYCAHCERLAVSSGNAKYRSRLGGKSQKMYRHKAGASCGCNRHSVMRHEIEGDFFRLMELLHVKDEYIPIMAQWALQLDETPIQDETDFEAEKAKSIALCQRRIDATIHLYGDGHITRPEYEQRMEQNKRDLLMWQSRTSDKQKVTIELTKIQNLIGENTIAWHNSNEQDKQGLAQTIFDHIVYDLDKKQIVGCKLKGWAERYMTLRGMLYEGYEWEYYEGTAVTPTSEHPLLRYTASIYPSVALILPHKSSSPRLDMPNFGQIRQLISHSVMNKSKPVMRLAKP